MTAQEFIKSEEGLRLTPYRCSMKKLTIGYGHNMEANPLPADIAAYLAAHGAISTEMAERLFAAKFADVERAARGLVKWDSLNETRKAVVASMIFQMGEGGFMAFRTTRRLIDAGKYARAALAMLKSRWEDQTEDRAHRSAIMMATGEWL